MDFDLIPDVRDVRIFIASLLTVLGPAIVSVWTFAALDLLDWSTALSFSILVPLVASALAFSMTRSRFGKITIDEDGITIRKGAGGLVRLRFSWRNIGTLESVTEPGISVPGISCLARWSGVPKENRIVRVELRARNRPGLIKRAWLNLVWGSSDSVRLATPDPVAVISAARRWPAS